MDTWEFLQQDDGAWYWRHTNGAGSVRTSAACFEFESDCVGNAIYHGYVPCASVVTHAGVSLSL